MASGSRAGCASGAAGPSISSRRSAGRSGGWWSWRRRMRGSGWRSGGGGSAPARGAPAGAEGQLGAAMEVARDLGVEIPTIGLAKQFEEVFLPGRRDPLLLSRRSPALFLLQRIRDEAHRFGLAYHRKLRGKRQTRSSLDEISG